MKKGGRFERFRDRFLTPWWSRYLVVPIMAGLPGGLVALHFGLHVDDPGPFWLRGYEPWAILGAAIWAGAISMFKSALNDVAAFTVNELKRSRDELVRLMGHVRVIVGFKSQRFADAIRTGADPSEMFLTITQPELQIARIVESIYAFYVSGNSEPDERVMVSLMRWNSAKNHLDFERYFPEADPPTIPADRFRDSSTAAGRAYHERCLIVCDDVSRDPRFLHVGPSTSGSMFAYPVEDPLLQRVVFVINVFSTRSGRFQEVDSDAIGVVMEVFADRLLLEDRLLQLRQRALAVGGPSK